MADNDVEPKFSVDQEVTIHGGSAIYIVKSRKWDDDEIWSMWIYDCFLKEDKKESIKSFPEQVLVKADAALPPGRAVL
jgi:hypothetical protein